MSQHFAPKQNQLRTTVLNNSSHTECHIDRNLTFPLNPRLNRSTKLCMSQRFFHTLPKNPHSSTLASVRLQTAGEVIMVTVMVSWRRAQIITLLMSLPSTSMFFQFETETCPGKCLFHCLVHQTYLSTKFYI